MSQTQHFIFNTICLPMLRWIWIRRCISGSQNWIQNLRTSYRSILYQKKFSFPSSVNTFAQSWPTSIKTVLELVNRQDCSSLKNINAVLCKRTLPYQFLISGLEILWERRYTLALDYLWVRPGREKKKKGQK